MLMLGSATTDQVRMLRPTTSLCVSKQRVAYHRLAQSHEKQTLVLHLGKRWKEMAVMAASWWWKGLFVWLRRRSKCFWRLRSETQAALDFLCCCKEVFANRPCSTRKEGRAAPMVGKSVVFHKSPNRLFLGDLSSARRIRL